MKILLLLLGIQFHRLGHQGHMYGPGAQGIFWVPDLPTRQHVRIGDINIGTLWPLSWRSGKGMGCSNRVNLFSFQGLPNAMDYAVEQFNMHNPLPKNMTLGFIILDNCGSVNKAAVQALKFIEDSSCAAPKDPSQLPLTQCENQMWFDVVVMMCCRSSQVTMVVANILRLTNMPMVSSSSTSDQLSNTVNFPNFMRTILPIKFQYSIILEICLRYHWNYVSVIFAKETFGEAGLKTLEHLFDKHSICIAMIHSLSSKLTKEEEREIADAVIHHIDRARVVIMIAPERKAMRVVKAVARRIKPNDLLWIANDGWSRSVIENPEVSRYMLGSLLVSFAEAAVPDFDRWLSQRKPENSTPYNNWFNDCWESFFYCSFREGTCNSKQNLEGLLSSDYSNKRRIGYIVDTVNMIGNATSRVLQSPECQNLTGDAARHCVTGPRIHKELIATKQMELDENGDRCGKILVFQLRLVDAKIVEVPVAEFDFSTKSKSFSSNLSWDYHHLHQGFDHVDSQCSFPCKRHEAKHVTRQGCCWSCVPCKVNERLINNGVTCEKCPDFTWPDSKNLSACRPIIPKMMKISSPEGILQVTLCLVCICICAFVSVFFQVHGDHRVIKASSRVLSNLILVGISTGYATIIIFMLPPTTMGCRIGFVTLGLSFALIYGPLLIRTMWVHRVFEASMKSTRLPRFSNSKHQILFCSLIILSQTIVATIPLKLHSKWQTLTSPNLNEPYVEFTCDFPLKTLAIVLFFDFTLAVACCFLAFKTRHLPEGFNESKFITICIITVLTIFVGFIPTYVVTRKPLLKMLIMNMVIFLNHSISLVFLFLPKVYAVLHVKEKLGTDKRKNPHHPEYLTSSVAGGFCKDSSYRAPKLRPLNLKAVSKRIVASLEPSLSGSYCSVQSAQNYVRAMELPSTDGKLSLSAKLSIPPLSGTT